MASMRGAALGTYNRKRNFRITPEPAGKREVSSGAHRSSSRNMRQAICTMTSGSEWDGVLKSWALPKGPSLDPAVKRMAVEVEDHPLSYGDFEGIIPAGQYGAGSVILWDRGSWNPVGDVAKGFRDGRLKFSLDGEKLQGGFTLVRMRGREGEKRHNWLLIKERDQMARATGEFDVVAEKAASVAKKARGGRKSALPLALAPQLATLVASAPQTGDWDYELKLDGYRLLTRVDGHDVRCFTRNGHDWSHRLPGIVKAVRALRLGRCWLDGEIIVTDDAGAPDFQKLQNAFDTGGTVDVHYIVFDLLFHDGKDLREQGVRERREQLRVLLGKTDRKLVQFSATLKGDPAHLLAAAAEAGFEGLVGKRADAPYYFPAATATGSSSRPVRARSLSSAVSLILRVHAVDWVHCCWAYMTPRENCATPAMWARASNQLTLEKLRKKLGGIQMQKSPFEGGPQRVGTVRRVVPHWVHPKLVAEIAFAG